MIPGRVIASSIAVALIIVLLPVSTIAASQNDRAPAEATDGMVVSSHYLASDVGARTLQDGGNAIDL